jgi:hypothetical protein
MTEQGQGPAQVSHTQEPYVDSGGKQDPGGDRDMPPYEDRQTTGMGQEELTKERGGPGYSDVGPRTVSEAEREGVSDTDPTGASPQGVGESINKQGNERMANKSAAAHESDQKDAGVGGRTKNIDPESPDVLSGDQGG